MLLLHTLQYPARISGGSVLFEAVCNVREIRKFRVVRQLILRDTLPASICPFTNARSVFAIRITKQRRQQILFG